MTDYNTLKRQARQLENELSHEFSTECDLGVLTKLITQFGETLDQLSEAQNHHPAGQTLPAITRLERHREVLLEYQAKFRSLKAKNQAGEERKQLLATSSSSSGFNKRMVEMEENRLLTERERLDSSHRMMDVVTEQAIEVRDELVRQRIRLERSQGILGNISGQLPSLSSLIGKIRSRKLREGVILMVVICLGMIFFLWRSFLSKL